MARRAALWEDFLSGYFCLKSFRESPMCPPLGSTTVSGRDVPLMHSLVRAVPYRAGLALVGDVDQLPSGGIARRARTEHSLAEGIKPNPTRSACR
jgi:hypothetical protein